MNVRSPAEVAIPWLHLDVVFAATPDVPSFLAYFVYLFSSGHLETGEFETVDI